MYLFYISIYYNKILLISNHLYIVYIIIRYTYLKARLIMNSEM